MGQALGCDQEDQNENILRNNGQNIIYQHQQNLLNNQRLDTLNDSKNHTYTNSQNMISPSKHLNNSNNLYISNNNYNNNFQKSQVQMPSQQSYNYSRQNYEEEQQQQIQQQLIKSKESQTQNQYQNQVYKNNFDLSLEVQQKYINKTPSPNRNIKQEYSNESDQKWQIQQQQQQQQQNYQDYLNRIEYLKQIVQKTDKLVLRVVSSACLQKDQILNITAQGLQGGFRNQLDGNTYFGFQKEIITQDGKIEIVNDFEIPSTDQETNLKHIGQHFQIFFDTITFMYNIQDFGNGLGVFLRLTKPVTIKDNYLFSIGHIFLVANLEIQGEEHILHLKSYDQNGHLEQRKFSSLQKNKDNQGKYVNRKIQVGRSKKNDIYCSEDNLLSKVHCYIKFDLNNNCWFLTDNESTNGSWIYLQEPLAIQNGMIFKYNQTIFQAVISQ